MTHSLYKITEKTEFPIIEDNQEFVISANTLLRNIQLLLGQATTRQFENNQKDILCQLSNIEQKLQYCLCKSKKADSLAESNQIFNNKIWERTSINNSNIGDLQVKVEDVLKRLEVIETKLNKDDNKDNG